MDYKEFDVEAFKENSMKRRKELQEYILMKDQHRKKRLKMVKGIIAGGSAIVIMGIGIIKYFPAMFITSEAKDNINDYSSTQMQTEVKANTKTTTNQNITGSTNSSSVKSNKRYKITKESIDNEKVTESTEKTTETAEKETTVNKREKETKAEVKMTVGGNGDDQVANFLNTETGQYVYYYSDCYGVDPNIIASICMQETGLEHERCCPGGDRYSGYGVGICQLESPDGSLEVTAHNYKTGEDDTLVVTMENACDVETNIQIACAEAQNSLNDFNGNPLLAIQSHNYGKDMLNLVLNNSYSDPQSIINDYSNSSWIEYVQYAHTNPGYYITNWEFDSYGDGDYVYHVLSHCPEKEISYIYNDQRINFRLDTLEITNIEDINTNTKTN